jgi:hypothetical protein
MNITLTPDIEETLTEKARVQGTTPETLALDYLRERLVQPDLDDTSGEGEETLADLLADYIGVLDSGEFIPGGARMSEKTGEAFTAILAQEHRQNGQ